MMNKGRRTVLIDCSNSIIAILIEIDVYFNSYLAFHILEEEEMLRKRLQLDYQFVISLLNNFTSLPTWAFNDYTIISIDLIGDIFISQSIIPSPSHQQPNDFYNPWKCKGIPYFYVLRLTAEPQGQVSGVETSPQAAKPNSINQVWGSVVITITYRNMNVSQIGSIGTLSPRNQINLSQSIVIWILQAD